MSIVKKILILVTVVIFLVVLWRLIVVRMALRTQFGPGPSIPGTNIEGLEPFSFLSTNEAVELRRVENSSKITMTSAPTSIRDLSLSELCVKASYNSAISGNYVNLDMLGYVIGRGCRYLDFEVLYVPVDESSTSSYAPMKPVVGFTNATDYSTVGSYNTIVLDKVLGYAVAAAFSPSCPNHKDPLFINLRVKSNNTGIYPDIAAALDNSIGPKIYSDPGRTVYTDLSTYTGINPALPVTKNTVLSDIMGKVVVLMDKTVNPNYINYSSNCPSATASTGSSTTGPCYDLANYVNIQNGSQDMNLVLYSFVTVKPTIQILDDDVHTTVQHITVANPDNMFLMNPANKNPNYGDYILKYGCQWVPYRFYQNDVALETYEKFFNDHGSAFVPMVSAISYFMNMS